MFDTKKVRELVEDLRTMAYEIDCNSCHCWVKSNVGYSCAEHDPCILEVAANVLLVEAVEQERVMAMFHREFFREIDDHDKS